MSRRSRLKNTFLSLLFSVYLLLISLLSGVSGNVAYAAPAGTIEVAFSQASQETHVPVSLLKAICFQEGRLSNHQGTPSIDGGYGCMHLIKNHAGDTFDQAASELHVSAQQLRTDLFTNIRGGAYILRDEALHLPGQKSLPTSLAGWYGAIVAYSHATLHSTALLYANNIYHLLNTGFSSRTENGERVTLAPEVVSPDKQTANGIKAALSLPNGCKDDGKTDFPGAIDCILDPQVYDCNVVSSTAPCNYEDANRPGNDPTKNAYPIKFVGIHDIEGTALNALNVFQDPTNGSSVHYIVDSDGTIYQVVREKDIAYHIGNFWYNQRSVGIEHAGVDATGYQWYNATEYLASARLTAYLLQKYHIPLDRSTVIGHENTPSPALVYEPNHVDPGPYWMWDYYFHLIRQLNMPFQVTCPDSHVLMLHPASDQKPANPDGTETTANFSFFSLYTKPDTRSALVPHQGASSDITTIDDNLGPAMSFYYVDKVPDAANAGTTMYEVWYGEEDQTSGDFANAHLAWLAVPAGSNPGPGTGQVVHLKSASATGTTAEIYGKPVTSETYHIGDAPVSAIFVSAFTTYEETSTGITNQLWYEINFNHRQAWVPASEVA